MSAAQVRAYVGKAEEYLSAATAELDADHRIVATSLAIHAGIKPCQKQRSDQHFF